MLAWYVSLIYIKKGTETPPKVHPRMYIYIMLGESYHSRLRFLLLCLCDDFHWSLCTLYLFTCQLRVTIDDLYLCVAVFVLCLSHTRINSFADFAREKV